MLNLNVILCISIASAVVFAILLVYFICNCINEGKELWRYRSTLWNIFLIFVFAGITISCWTVVWNMGDKEELNQTIINREEISGINGDTLYFVNNNEVTTRSLQDEMVHSRLVLTDEDSSYIARIRLDNGLLYYYETTIFLSENDYNRVTGNDTST